MQIEVTEQEFEAPQKAVGRVTSLATATRTLYPLVLPGGAKPLDVIPIPGRDYAMGKYPITQAQYEAVMGANPSYFEGPDHPVETVSWDDAQAFCAKLSALSGNTVRLPTKAEWEHACRAGSTTNYCNGDTVDDLDKVGWYSNNSDGTTHPVGQKASNAWGLYDMHGNIWEWCEDKFGPSGAARVVRGGSWYGSPGLCRSSNRFWFASVNRIGNCGFRVVASSSSSSSSNLP